jgi:hypothetical protein
MTRADAWIAGGVEVTIAIEANGHVKGVSEAVPAASLVSKGLQDRLQCRLWIIPGVSNC